MAALRGPASSGAQARAANASLRALGLLAVAAALGPAHGAALVAAPAAQASAIVPSDGGLSLHRPATRGEGALMRRADPRPSFAGPPASFDDLSTLVETVYRSLVPLGTSTAATASADRARSPTPVLQAVCLPTNPAARPEAYLRSQAFQEHVRRGLQAANNTRIVFAGLWRQVGRNGVKLLYSALSRLGDFFRDYQIIMLENDSTDDTVAAIQEVCGHDPHGSCFTLRGLGKQILHTGSPQRVKGLTALRQSLLQKVVEFDKTGLFDYVMMVDGDIFAEGNGGFDLGGSLAALSLTQPGPAGQAGATGVCAFQLSGKTTRYRDTFAHRGPECTYSSLIQQPTCEADSCGGGLVLYSLNAVRQGGCGYSYMDEKTCEHIPFNMCLKEHDNRIVLSKMWAIAMKDFGEVSPWACEA